VCQMKNSRTVVIAVPKATGRRVEAVAPRRGCGVLWDGWDVGTSTAIEMTSLQGVVS